MQLVYFRDGNRNFGDEINGQLWPALVPGFFEEESDVGFKGIGTIIGRRFGDFSKIHVFSSGAGLDAVASMKSDYNFECVRGPLTADLLNLSGETAVTDGAILAPLLWPAAPKTGRTIVIPHWKSLKGCEAEWRLACEQAGCRLVSPMQPVETVLGEISSAGRVLTESLHGAVIADAYGVPWSAWRCSIGFSEFKWMDWALSIGAKLRVWSIAPPVIPIRRRYGLAPQTNQSPIDLDADRIRDEGCRIMLETHQKESRTARAFIGLKSLSKRFILSDSFGNSLGFSPKETAQGLRRLMLEPSQTPSTAETREALQKELLCRLDAFARRHGAELEGSKLNESGRALADCCVPVAA